MVETTLREGMTHSIQKRVNYEDSSVSFGRSGVETLFSTTALTGMMIEVAVDLVGNHIPDDCITVVKKMEISHEKPTLQGMTVTVKATLEEIKGSVLTFSIVCFDELGEIARGKQERHIVNKGVFIRRAHERGELLTR